eukprot:c9476_g1_i1.p1 GENE.c9476_g1_i1~~c9476_g1_i1.p1  ORF type:complete len:520 (-),score=100.95 c9476_g1_i1:48-1607(-)
MGTVPMPPHKRKDDFRRPVMRAGGDTPSFKHVKDKKLKRNLKSITAKQAEAIEHAVQAEVLLPAQGGFLEAEGDVEQTWRFRQHDIQEHVDLQSASKLFQLELPLAAPYRASFSHNGRHAILCGRKGHVATFDMITKSLGTELELRETTRDAIFLHNNTLFATAQAKSVFIYDETGAEVHCMRNHFEPTRLAFLRYHFLLTSINTGGVLRYTDTSTGASVAEHYTKMGACNVMHANPYNAVINLGHPNGTVSLWSPNLSKPLAKILCHRGALTAISIERQGRYLVTSGLDGQIKVWDLRSYKQLHSYYSPLPAVSISISDRGLMALGYGSRVQVWQDALATKQASPYMNHSTTHPVESLAFQPFDDVLAIGTAGGFETMLVPGSAEANFDALEANPYETVKQRSETEVHALLEKLPPDTITLDPSMIGKIRKPSQEENNEKRKLMLSANNKKVKVKNKMKGRNKLTKRLRRKNVNIVDEKQHALRELREKREKAAKAGKPAAPSEPQNDLDRALMRFSS